MPLIFLSAYHLSESNWILAPHFRMDIFAEPAAIGGFSGEEEGGRQGEPVEQQFNRGMARHQNDGFMRMTRRVIP